MKDLKLIDELLCDIKDLLPLRTWREVAKHSSITRKALARIKEAKENNEIDKITLSLSRYLETEHASIL